MKDFITSVLAICIVLPCLLIVNESDTFVPNIIGAIYTLLLLLIAKTDKGRVIINYIDKLINKI
jgi:hypothetical protein